MRKKEPWTVRYERAVCREWERREDQAFSILHPRSAASVQGESESFPVSREEAEEMTRAEGA